MQEARFLCNVDQPMSNKGGRLSILVISQSHFRCYACGCESYYMYMNNVSNIMLCT